METYYLKKSNIFDLVVALFACTIPFVFSHALFFVFSLVFVIYHIRQKNAFSIGFTLQHLPLLFLGGYVITTLSSFLWSDNLPEALARFEKSVPFVIILFLSVFLKKERPDFLNRAMRFYSFGVLALLILVTGNLVYSYWFGQLKGIINFNGVGYLDLLAPFGHRTYLGIIILMAFPIWSRQAQMRQNMFIRLTYLLLMVYASIILILSGARGIQISMVVVWVLLVLHYLQGWLSKGILSLVAIVLFGAGIGVIQKSPRFIALFEAVKENNVKAAGEKRITTWNAAADIIEDNFVGGVGIGDASTEFTKTYRKNKNYFAEENQLNAHNQFLETWVSSGIFAVVFLALFFISIIFASPLKRLYAIIFVAVYGINMAFESILLRNLGVVPLVFWVIVLLFFSDKQEIPFTRKMTTAHYHANWVLWTVLLIVLFYASEHTFNGKNPQTFMIYPFENKEVVLPNKAKANAAELDVKNVEWVQIKDGVFTTVPFFRTYKSLNINVTSSVWVQVPEDSKYTSVQFYNYSKNAPSYVVDYDLSKKGTWQLLQFDGKQFEKGFEIGVRVDYRHKEATKFKSNMGKILIANPFYRLNPILSN